MNKTTNNNRHCINIKKRDCESKADIGTINEYEELYSKIQEITTEVVCFCSPMFAKNPRDEVTQQLMSRLSEIAVNLSDVAHELEEHLAWD